MQWETEDYEILLYIAIIVLMLVIAGLVLIIDWSAVGRFIQEWLSSHV